MSDHSKIAWTDASWNPVRGCTKISPGCANCYAQTFAERWRGIPGHPYEQGFDVRLVPEALGLPLHWRKPRRIFVNSMSDLFHEKVPLEFIEKVWAIMANCPQHTFQILTKRSARMREVVDGDFFRGNVMGQANRMVGTGPDHERLEGPTAGLLAGRGTVDKFRWPLPNVWLGVSVENQAAADERIPLLLETPAAVRFVSAEPLLGPVDLRGELVGNVTWDSVGREVARSAVDWVIVGGESGARSRPCDVAWVRSIVERTRAAQIPCFVKQLGAVAVKDLDVTGKFRTDPESGRRQLQMTATSVGLRDRAGADPSEWPADLRVQQMPEVR